MLAGLQLRGPQLCLGEAANLLSPTTAPCPCSGSGQQQDGLESSVHKLCKVVCEQLLS